MAASAMQAATIVSALGGVLYVLGASSVYGITALLFAISALLCTMIKPLVRPTRLTPTGSSLAYFREGIRFIRTRRAVLGAISLDLFAVLLGRCRPVAHRCPSAARDRSLGSRSAALGACGRGTAEDFAVAGPSPFAPSGRASDVRRGRRIRIRDDRRCRAHCCCRCWCSRCWARPTWSAS